MVACHNVVLSRLAHPSSGQFLQTDPIGYEDDLNLYAYVRNDPLTGVDPIGTRRLEITLGGRAVFGVGVGAAVKVRVDFPGGGEDNTPWDLGGSVEVSGRAGLEAGLDASVDIGSLVSDNSPTDQGSDLRSITVDGSAGVATPLGGIGGTVEGPDLTAPQAGGGETSGSASANLAEVRARAGPRFGLRAGASFGVTARFGGTIREATSDAKDERKIQ